jgi:hypothetical protein
MAASGVPPTHDVTANLEKDNNRPPIYVPSKRDPANGRVGLRDSLNGVLPPRDSAGSIASYQPKTSFSYVPSAEVA